MTPMTQPGENGMGKERARAILVEHARANDYPRCAAAIEKGDDPYFTRVVLQAMLSLADEQTKPLLDHIDRLTEDNVRLRAAFTEMLGNGDCGTWWSAVEPLIARFTTAAQFGADAVHNGEGAQAIADLFKAMASRLDNSVILARQALTPAPVPDTPNPVDDGREGVA